MGKKILFILHLPPPVHGSSMVGQYIKDSAVINQEFITQYIDLGTSKTIDEIGKNPLKKVRAYSKIIGNTIQQLWQFKPNLVYMAITAKGIGFYKDFLVVVLAKIIGVPLVLHFHNKGVREKQHQLLDHILYQFLFRKTKVILLSRYLYEDIKKYVKEEDVFYCPNGIPKVAIEGKENLQAKSDTVQLLFLSNLIESKGVFVLLEACKLLRQRGLLFSCSFIGGEGDINAAQFQEQLKVKGLEQTVFYLGKKYGHEKEKEFLKAAIFVLPTFYHNECFPLVLLEAMQFELPIVSTFEGGIPDMIEENKTGFLVQQKEVTALADKLELLIKNPEMRKQLGVAAKAKFEKEFTLVTFETNLKKILHSVLIN